MNIRVSELLPSNEKYKVIYLSKNENIYWESSTVCCNKSICCEVSETSKYSSKVSYCLKFKQKYYSAKKF